MRSSADLREYLEHVDACYFDGHLAELAITIGWSRRPVLRLGGYWSDLRRIELNRRLAYPWVPRMFVLSVIHHEALHAVFGPEHSKAFHAAEKQFALSFEARAWENENVNTLLETPAPKGLR